MIVYIIVHINGTMPRSCAEQAQATMCGIADADAASNSSASIAAQQLKMLPQYGVPSMLWPQQQPWPGLLQSSSAWGGMAAPVCTPQ